MKYESDEIPDLTEVGGHWDDRPVKWHGTAGDFVCPGRRIARLPARDWPHEPEECTAGMFDTEWILDGQVLLCVGCGIDAT